MHLRPHFHLLVPSGTKDILLETRLYLPASVSIRAADSLSTTTRSNPIPSDQLPSTVLTDLRGLGVHRCIVAAHPWGRLGGNMLDPVLTDHLLSAVFADPSDVSTAVVTYNARGVGGSQGSSAWFTPGTDPADFAAVEVWAMNVLGGMEAVTEVRRFGYSWGCISATLAPRVQAHRISSLMLVSPPLSFLPAVTYFSGSFDKVLSDILAKPDALPMDVWAIYGDVDLFTGIKAYRAWAERLLPRGLRSREVTADHFWRDSTSGDSLRLWISQWLA